jgi:Flp pilus assembly CpaE family ATPase
LDVPALHQAKVVVQKLLDSGYARAQLHLILNRAPRRYEVTLGELEKMIGAPVHTTIPDDYAALNESYSEGKLLSSTSSLGKHFVRLASKIAGVDKTAKKRFSLFGQ